VTDIRKNLLAAGLMMSVCSFALQAQAADGAAPSGGVTSVDEVIVTASKQAENLRDVPASVTALGSDQIQREGLAYFADYVGKVPGLSFIQTSPQYNQLILRGISTGTAAPNASVATYIDEAPYGFSSPTGVGALMSPNIDAFDMARIEVLRGPQGTLYGSNAIGGLLKYVTQAPDPTGFSAVAQGGVLGLDGETGWDLHGAVNVPLGESAAIRLVGYHVDRPGYIDNPVLGTENTNDFQSEGLRAQLLVDLSPDVTLRLSALTQRSETGDQGSMDVDRITLKPIYADLAHARVVNAPGKNENQLYNATLDWDLGFATLVSSTSYAVTRTELQFDLSGTYTPYLFFFFGAPYGAANNGKIRDDKITQEVRLTSPRADDLTWQVGVFYTREDLSTVTTLSPITPVTNIISPGLLGPLADSDESGEYREFAGFANVGYKFTPTFDVDLGIRYSDIEADYTQVTAGAFLGPNDFDRSSSQNVFTYAASARWRASEETMVYARVARGYQPGGPNRVAPFVGVADSYDAATTTNYEAGVKSRLMDGKLNLELALFRIDWDDIQLAAIVGGFYSYTNGGAASSTGAEWNVDFVPIRGLTLNLNGAYTDAQLEDDAPPSANAVAGDPLPYIPKWSASARADYEWAVTDSLNGFAGASWRYTGARQSDFSEDTHLPANSVWDLRLGIESERWTVTLFAKNVGDERVINSILPVSYSIPGGPLEAIVGPPRSFGATVTARF
jgi:iron complex outermembrane receptor protein